MLNKKFIKINYLILKLKLFMKIVCILKFSLAVKIFHEVIKLCKKQEED